MFKSCTNSFEFSKAIVFGDQNKYLNGYKTKKSNMHYGEGVRHHFGKNSLNSCNVQCKYCISDLSDYLENHQPESTGSY